MAEPSNPDYILDRRRLRRKLTFWRVAGLVLLGFVLIAGIARLTGLDPLSAARGEHIAEIAIDGVIVGSRERLDLIEELGNQDHVQAVIVKIDSPGGTTSGGEALYEALLALSTKKNQSLPLLMALARLLLIWPHWPRTESMRGAPALPAR